MYFYYTRSSVSCVCVFLSVCSVCATGRYGTVVIVVVVGMLATKDTEIGNLRGHIADALAFVPSSLYADQPIGTLL